MGSEMCIRDRDMALLLSPVDAEKRGITDGSIIEAWNDLARVQFYAKISEGVLPGTVVAEGVFGKGQALNGLTVNALLGEALTDGGEASTLCGNTVDIAPV